MACGESIAHVAEDGRCHTLYDHLTGTAERAAEMAGEFGCAEWGRLAGLWHDLGKYSEDFQTVITPGRNVRISTEKECFAVMESCPISLEISGSTAMWTRPDTGDSPVSYPVPTYSAAKGIFESIVRIETVEIVPTKVEICAPIVYHNYSTNYGGPLRKSPIMATRDSYQLLATVLINVCYRLYAELRSARDNHPLSEKAQLRASMGCNALHACQDIFNRRLERGQWHDIPFLGWREFIPDYIGPFRETTRVAERIDLVLPSFLHSVFEPSGNKKPVYKSDVHIRNGRLNYVE